jgi:hypothetical protein
MGDLFENVGVIVTNARPKKEPCALCGRSTPGYVNKQGIHVNACVPCRKQQLRPFTLSADAVNCQFVCERCHKEKRTAKSRLCKACFLESLKDNRVQHFCETCNAELKRVGKSKKCKTCFRASIKKIRKAV